jgi:3-oxoadipate enol-lactonase
MASRYVPEPPVEMPPARTVHVRGRGEVFCRDTGGDGPVVLLLHGWTASADLNWYAQYGPLTAAGYRVIAVDHRGHGRGMRALADFRLGDCADDAAGVLRELGIGSARVAGYSMGGPIGLLLARRHPGVVAGLVLCATTSNWRTPRMRAVWWSMAALRLALGLAPYALWRGGMRAAGLPDTAETTWVTGEVVRGSARDIAEAGRELGRFDARPWLPELRMPAAVVVTAQDAAVPPRLQRDLARRLGAPEFESPGDHLSAPPSEAFTRALLSALRAVDYEVSSPPSTGSTIPVTYEEASLARNRAAATSSCASPFRPAGTRNIICSR